MIKDLIKFFSNKENYETNIKYIKQNNFPPEVRDLLNYLPTYFNNSGNSSVLNWNDLFLSFSLSNPSNKYQELIKLLCEQLDKDTNPLRNDILQLFTDRKFADLIDQECNKVLEGQYQDNSLAFVKIQDLFDGYKRDSVSLSKKLQEAQQEDLMTSLSSIKRTGFKWLLEPLNTILGPLNSELIIIASRPDGGKTTFLAQEAWYLATQLPEDKQILWFNNEEHIKNVKLRVMESCLGQTKDTILDNLVDSIKEFEKIVPKNKIIFIDDCVNVNTIEKNINKFNPGLIIVDQLYKVKGKFYNDYGGQNSDMEVERLRQLCGWMRDIAKHTAPCLVTNQLDGTAEGQQFPSMSTLYGSKTGMQGEADAILLIGRSPATPDQRYFHTPKNKLTGNTTRFTANLDKAIGRFEAI